MIIVYVIALLSVLCLLTDFVIMTKRFNKWYLNLCCKRADNYNQKEVVNSWLTTHIQEDKGNEVVWKDLRNAIKKDTGIQLDAGLLRGFMYKQGFKTISDYVIDTYVFAISYKTK